MVGRKGIYIYIYREKGEVQKVKGKWGGRKIGSRPLVGEESFQTYPPYSDLIGFLQFSLLFPPSPDALTCYGPKISYF